MARFSITAAGGGSVRFRGCPVYHGTYLKPSYLEFREAASDSPIDWAPGDYVDYPRTGLRYYLYDLPECVQNSERTAVAERYVYSNVRLYARTEDLERCVFRDLVSGDNTAHFSSRRTFSTYEALDGVARRIQACLDADYPGEWSVETDPDLAASVPSVSEERELSAESGETVLSVLDKVYSLWENVGWTHAYDAATGVNRLVIGGANTRRAGNTVAGGSIGRGRGLVSVKVSYSRMDDVCTRLYPFGSTRNMRARYYNSLNIKDAASADIPNLMIPVSEWGRTDGLPDPRKAFIRVASVRDERLLGVRRKVVYFDGDEYGEIYPSIEGVTIGNVRGAMSPSDRYYPSEGEYADADRADEIKSARTEYLDDGTGAAGAVTQTVSPELDADMSGSVGAAGSVTLSKYIGDAVLTMGRWSDILIADGQAEIRVRTDSGVTLDGAWLTVEQMGNEARVELLHSYDSSLGRYTLGLPDGCELGHEGFFTVSDVPKGGTLTLRLGLEVTASGSRYLGSSAVEVTQSQTAPIEVSLRDGRPSSAPVALRQIGFDLNSQRVSEGGRVGTLEMKTGACAGRSFSIERCSYSSSGDEWSLRIRRVTDRSLNMTFPNSTYPIKAGDRFVITDIRMPDRYIEYASQRLLARAKEVLAELSRPTAVLTPSVDAKFVREGGASLVEGRFLECAASLLSQGYLSIGAYSDLMDTVTINEGEAAIPTYSITLRERPRKSFRTESRDTDSVEEVGADGTVSSSSSAAGQKGDKGEPGEKGDQGEKGEKGDPGRDGVGVSSVEQTEESEESGGVNVVTVTLTDGASSEFRVRNGQKGDKGEPGEKGLDGSPGASGKDGAPAGFGTPAATATALAAGSAPTVSVTATGPDAAKVFSFAFGIPRGKSGDGSGGGAETMPYPDFLDLADKDAETLYAVTYKGSCDLWLGGIRITENITAVLPEAITLSGAAVITGGRGATAQYTAALSPSGTTERGVTFRCAGSAASIAPSGVLTASGRGKVTVRSASLARPSVRSAGLEVSVNETMELRLSGGGFDGAAAKYKYLFVDPEQAAREYLLIGTGYSDGRCVVDEEGMGNISTVIGGNISGKVLLFLAADAECSDYIEAATVTVEALLAVETSWEAVEAFAEVDAGGAAVTDPSWDLPSSYTYDKEGNNTPTALITDEDNAGWMLSYPDWIVAEGGMTSGSGSFSLMLSAYSNTGAARSGEILLKSADGKKTFGRCVVTQEGAASGGTLSVSPETLTGEYMGLRGTDLGSVTVTADQPWTAELGGLLRHVAISPSSGTGDAVIKLTEIYGASFDESGTLTVTAADGKTATVKVTMKY